jgi:hypothetical protein
MLSLTINHNIHITREQRYLLYNGHTVETVGISIPVWLTDEFTSEPAKEIFCKYTLKNDKDGDKPIQINKDGYEITLPYRTGKTVRKLSDRDWLKLSMKKPEVLNKYYSQQLQERSCSDLLDLEDGGGKCLIYREQDKFIISKKTFNVMHYIKIDDMQELLNSIY